MVRADLSSERQTLTLPQSRLPRAQSNLGNAFKEQGCLEEAVTSYQTALDIQPDYAEVYYNLGSVLSEHK